MYPSLIFSINTNDDRYTSQLLVKDRSHLNIFYPSKIKRTIDFEGDFLFFPPINRLVNFNDVDRGGNSPLHIAAMNGRAINAEILLRTAKEKAESNEAEDQVVHQKFGLASINRLNKSRFYPLHLAVLNNHLNCVKVLLEYGAQVDCPTSTSSGKLTPLMLACQKGHLKIVTHLIENGAKVEARDRFKRTPLIHACMCGHAHIVSYLLRLGANAQVFDSSSNSALHYAMAYGWYFCVKLLVKAGAKVNFVNSWQTTCLAAGFLKGHYGLCDYLLTEHHVDINFKTDDGLTLVMLTVGLEITISSVKQLEYVVDKHKADCTAIDADGNNAFHYLANNISNQNSSYLSEDDRTVLRTNIFQISNILLSHQCNPNQLNNKAQSPLMIALECGNDILVDYLINKAKIDVNADISHNGKTLLHYFAIKCDQYNLVQTLIQLPMSDELKKMGQIYDNKGRTAFHYCAEKFNEFCERNQSSQVSDKLKQQYQSIFNMIEYCLDVIQCDPDAEIQSNSTNDDELVEKSDDDDEEEDEDESDNDEDETRKIVESMDNSHDDEISIKPKQTSIFFLLRSIPWLDQSFKHPLDIFVRKSNNLNVLHHETRRTPLLHAISLQQSFAVQLLIAQPSCDINLTTSKLVKERQQTPLILACKLQFLSAVRNLLNDNRCHLAVEDYQHNQAIHYYLSTNIRSNSYLDILNLFISKLKAISHLNVSGKNGRTPLHIAVYHNPGSLDSTNDVEQKLIDNGSDLLLKDSLGNIPLHNLFLNKNNGDDPVELCVLLVKAMKSKSIDVENNQGNTPLHLAVFKRSIVCVTLLQQYSANLMSENKLSNSVIGTCIEQKHLDLFISFLQLQSAVDIDLNKMQTTKIKKSNRESEIWKWKYVHPRAEKDFEQNSLIHLIIASDWQGALSLIFNDLDRYHLTDYQILESAILNRKLNLVLRLFHRLKDQNLLSNRNSSRQNFFHLLANLNQFDVNIYEQILEYLHELNFDWNSPDRFGSYPIHYACAQQNFVFLNFFREKYPSELDFNQLDAFQNTPTGLLFWKIGSNQTFAHDQLRPFIKSSQQLDCLCNYDNDIAMNPFSFGYTEPILDKLVYPPNNADNQTSNNVRTSPLINAIVYNNFELVKLLLELGADVNYSDEEKRTPLMHAVRQNNLDMVKLLLNKNYNPNENTEIKKTKKKTSAKKFYLGSSTTTTAAAAAAESSTTVSSKSDDFVVTSSIDLNAHDSLGRTCIHHLVQPFPDGSYTSNLDLLRLLVRSGASLTKLDLAGLSPLQYGVISGCQHLCDELTRLMNESTESTQATIERFYTNDPNKDLLNSSIDFYADAREYIEKYHSSHSLTSTKSFYEVDQLSEMKYTGELCFDDELNLSYDVRLIKIDVNYGQFGLYNFYRLQIIKHKSKENLYFLFTRWGRIGENGQHQLTPYSTIDECRKEFIKTFKEKTGNQWKDIYEFESKPKKYRLIELNEAQLPKYSNVPIDFNRLQSEKDNASSKIQSNIYRNFFKIFFNQQAIRTNIHKTQLDIEWMPISQLKRETLDKGKDLLKKIKNLLVKQQQLTLAMQKSKTIDQQNDMRTILNEIYELTNEYYTIIPLKGYSDGKLPVLDKNNLVQQQEKILEDLAELELAYKIFLGAQANRKTIAPLDYFYRSMNCQFEAMNKDNIDSELILRYIWSSAQQIQVEQIFKIARINEDERLFKSNLDNHYLLWHGTGICNLISILTRGRFVFCFCLIMKLRCFIKVFWLHRLMQQVEEVYLEK